MHSLSEHQILITLLALAVILAFSRGAGELARRVGQPEVLGELFAGFLLGPSVLDAVLPSLHGTLFLNGGVSFVLSGFSWVGAILVLLIAGMEVDLDILRKEAKPGALAAALAIVPSLVAGTVFAWWMLGRPPRTGLFLGIVMSVTAVSVAAKILMERGETRRGYAQVILAAGIASEVLVWLFVSVASSLRGSSPFLVGLRSAVFAVVFFAFAVTLGRRFTFWAMRRVRDVAQLAKGRLTLVLTLTFLAAAITHALGLHALLGAFVFGVILSQAPRANEALIEDVRSLTIGLFGPIFFVLAGMRVDVLQLGSFGAIGVVALLFAVATTVKVGFSALGARLGGRGGWESVLIGVGLNLKGGTDVVVAVVGVDLGLMSARAYTMYAVVAMLTVFMSPLALGWLERRAPPTGDEVERLESEEAQRRAYLPGVERVLVPIGPHVLSSLAASVVERIAASKHEQGQLLDIVRFEVEPDSEREEVPGMARARDRLKEAQTLKKVEVTKERIGISDALDRLLDTSSDYDLVAIGAQPPECNGALSFGSIQDAIIHRAETDVLVAIDQDEERFDCSEIRRILVPTNGLEYSMAAGDIAGALAEGCHAEVVLYHVVQGEEGEPWQGRTELMRSASGAVQELEFRINRLGVTVDSRVTAGTSVGESILGELERGGYDLIVLGAVDRGSDDHLYLGRPIQTILTQTQVPCVLLVSRG